MSEKLTKFLTPIVALFFATASGVTAATTIGTDIVTGGDLEVTGNSTLTGTLDVTGATTLANLSAIGTFTASTTAAGSDVNIKAMDSVTLVADQGVFTVNSFKSSGTYTELALSGNVGYIYSDDGTPSTSFDFSAYGFDFSGGSGTYIAFNDSSVGAGASQELYADATLFFADPAGGTNELEVRDGEVLVQNKLQLTGVSAPPIACAAGEKGSIYFDSDTNKPCYCNGTNWVLFSDDATTCS